MSKVKIDDRRRPDKPKLMKATDIPDGTWFAGSVFDDPYYTLWVRCGDACLSPYSKSVVGDCHLGVPTAFKDYEEVNVTISIEDQE